MNSQYDYILQISAQLDSFSEFYNFKLLLFLVIVTQDTATFFSSEGTTLHIIFQVATFFFSVEEH